jgi:hypothetical protein
MLFNEVAFVNLRKPEHVRSFVAVNSANQISARARFVLAEGVWVSLPFSPFGGVECSADFDLKEFLAFVLMHFKPEEKLKLVEAPYFYRNYRLALETLGWHKFRSEINHHLSLQEPVEVKKMQLRRLNKCQKAGFAFQKAETSTANAAIWHSFIAECRVQQGLEINISLGDFELAVEALTDKYDFFGVWDGTLLIAATVVVRVSTSVVYNYLPASYKAYNHYSPMVLLMHEVADYYNRHRFAYLDLGVSSISGVAQKGLCAFKESLGAVQSAKDYFEIQT